MASQREDVDLASGVVRVERGWDGEVGEVAPIEAGRRKVPIPAALSPVPRTRPPGCSTPSLRARPARRARADCSADAHPAESQT